MKKDKEYDVLLKNIIKIIKKSRKPLTPATKIIPSKKKYNRKKIKK
ncbi:MAG: hypothetical protein HYV52_02355 [Parcubacteria group bacterium]|nr:hypothetical protein [Parcubacteria group bacterium]